MGVLAGMLLAGCLTSPAPSGGSSTTTSTTTSSPPTETTAPTPVDDVALAMTATPSTIHPGDAVEVVLSATNHRSQTVWTNVGIVCTGSWDIRLYDASGKEVRIDDRDAMGCPSGGRLTGTIEQGASAAVNDSWDGRAHPRVGATAPLPPGDYTFRGSVRYADHANATNADGEPGEHMTNASARVTLLG